MVVAAQRAYRDAVSWLKGSRRRVDRSRFARRSLFGWFCAGTGLLSGTALVSASSFGLPGRNALRTGWPGWLLLGLVLASLLAAVAARRYLL